MIPLFRTVHLCLIAATVVLASGLTEKASRLALEDTLWRISLERASRAGGYDLRAVESVEVKTNLSVGYSPGPPITDYVGKGGELLTLTNLVHVTVSRTVYATSTLRFRWKGRDYEIQHPFWDVRESSITNLAVDGTWRPSERRLP